MCLFKYCSFKVHTITLLTADDLLCRLFDTEYFGGRSDSGTSPSSEAANQSQSQDTTSSTSNKGLYLTSVNFSYDYVYTYI